MLSPSSYSCDVIKTLLFTCVSMQMYGETINQTGYLYNFFLQKFFYFFNFSSPPSNEHCSFWVGWEKEYIGVWFSLSSWKKFFRHLLVWLIHLLSNPLPSSYFCFLKTAVNESKSAIWHFPQKHCLVIQGKLEFAHFVQSSSWGVGRWGACGFQEMSHDYI